MDPTVRRRIRCLAAYAVSWGGLGSHAKAPVPPREEAPCFTVGMRTLPAAWPWSVPPEWWRLDVNELALEIVRLNRAAKPLIAFLDARIALGLAPASLPRLDAADWDDAQYDRRMPPG
jgi:hypothetical protein